MTVKECIYRELRYGLCAGVLDGLLSPTSIKLDMRGGKANESTYPWLIFARGRNTEDNQVRYSRDEVDVVLIGLQSSATKGDALLEEIGDLLVDHFAGKTKTWGKFLSDGTADATGGLKLKAVYRGTEESFDATLEEKMHVLSFTFTRIR